MYTNSIAIGIACQFLCVMCNVYCNLVPEFSVVRFACKILDACVFAMNFSAFNMIIGKQTEKRWPNRNNEIV